MTDKTKKIFEKAGIQVEKEITDGFYKVKDPGVIDLSELSSYFGNITFYYKKDHKERVGSFAHTFVRAFFIMIGDENTNFDYAHYHAMIEPYDLTVQTFYNSDAASIDTIDICRGGNY
ncbi:MAG: hypothetical protein IJ733_08615 [Lachnospiraceae bacterium]|nr:hypothetical protein [Lachnospiraceae bacterium]